MWKILFLCFLHVWHRNGNRTRGGRTQWVAHSTSDARTSLQYCDLPESTTTHKSRPGLGEGGSEWKKGCFMEGKSFPSVQNRRTLGSLSKPMLALGCAEFSFFFFQAIQNFRSTQKVFRHFDIPGEEPLLQSLSRREWTLGLARPATEVEEESEARSQPQPWPWALWCYISNLPEPGWAIQFKLRTHAPWGWQIKMGKWTWKDAVQTVCWKEYSCLGSLS